MLINEIINIDKLLYQSYKKNHYNFITDIGFGITFLNYFNPTDEKKTPY